MFLFYCHALDCSAALLNLKRNLVTGVLRSCPAYEEACYQYLMNNHFVGWSARLVM
jgi:hypothetical protein